MRLPHELSMADNHIFIGSKYSNTNLWNHKYLLYKEDTTRRHTEMKAIFKIQFLLKKVFNKLCTECFEL